MFDCSLLTTAPTTTATATATGLW